MQYFFLREWLPDQMLKGLCWTLVHSLWQGLLAAALAGIIIVTTRKSSARLRYNLLGMLLVLFITSFAYTLNLQMGSHNPAGPIANRLFDGNNAGVVDIADHSGSLTVSSTESIDIFIRFLNVHAGQFMMVWAVFFLINCIKIFTGLAGVQRLRSHRIHLPEEGWQARLNYLSKALRIRQSVLLLQSELVKVPVAVGYLKPVILVPLGLLSNLPPEQVETILLHELAHIRRRDYLINLLQRFTEAVFFFNPALLWISSLIRQEREACCDDIVVANTTNKGSYLEALVSFQEYSLSASPYTMAISHKRNYLLNRVKRIITRENKKLNVMEKLFLVAGLAAITAFTFIPGKEILVKKQNTIEAPAKPAALQPPPAAPSAPRSQALVIKKENKKPVVLPIAVRDTVPPRSKIVTNDEINFPSISSNVNDDGKTRTETTTATDQNGKKYTITKLNNKVTSLSIDGRNIPENEIKDHEPLFQKIMLTQQENRAMRERIMELRKQEQATRVQERAARNEENQRRIETDNEKRKTDIKEREKQKDNVRKIIEMERKAREKERESRLKEMRNNRKIGTRENGKEVIWQDVKDENLKTTDTRREDDININSNVNVQNNSKLALQLTNKISTDINKLFAEKQDLNMDMNYELYYSKQANLNINQSINQKINQNINVDNKIKCDLKLKPVPPLPPECKPDKKAIPAPVTKTPTYPKKRVTA